MDISVGEKPVGRLVMEVIFMINLAISCVPVLFKNYEFKVFLYLTSINGIYHFMLYKCDWLLPFHTLS